MLVSECELHARVQELQDFLRLAKRGGHGGASGGEKRAHKLAAVIVDHVPGLDDKAVSGAIELVRLAAREPWTARDLIES
ncbi:MAG: hypothetical protein H0T51_07885 [Pirellulales bacterium]|nr:hypothetical protein [Pirellulales bacterium]